MRRLECNPKPRISKTRHCPASCCTGCTLTGVPRITFRPGRSICATTRCCAGRCRSATSSGGCSATGGRPRDSTSSTCISTASFASTRSTWCSSPVPVTVCPACWRTPISRERTASSIQTCRATSGVSQSSSRSFRFPAASRATRRPKHRDRSTKAVSSATASRTHSALHSTIRSCWSRAWWATAKRRPARSPRAGTRTSFSIRCATARCFPYCT